MIPIIFEVKQWLKKVQKKEGLDTVHKKVKLFKQKFDECMLMNFYTPSCKIDDYLDKYITHVESMADHLKTQYLDRGSVPINHNKQLVSENEQFLKLFADVTRVSIESPIIKRKQKKHLRNIQRTTEDLKNSTGDLFSEMKIMESKLRNLPQKKDSLVYSISDNSKKIKKEKKVLKPLINKNYQNLINYYYYKHQLQFKD